ncbi:MAG: flavin reductase family protein [Bacteroidales bacterium]|nr:flavin reductase family protein [Bacteroidales bacterium]MDD3665013.1 flavin reductase family protein [Bacteroidales bacterium]
MILKSPESVIYPVPAALISCGAVASPNLITIAWTGTVNSTPPMCYISVRKERFSHHLISEMRQFVINLMPSTLVQEVDFCGTKTGKIFDKFKETGLTPLLCEKLDTVRVGEAIVSLECEVVEILQLGSHDMFIANIVVTHLSDSMKDNSLTGLIHEQLLGYTKGYYHHAGDPLLNYGANSLKFK